MTDSGAHLARRSNLDKPSPTAPMCAETVPTSCHDAELSVITGAGLFPREEAPAEVAQLLLPRLTSER